MTNKAIYASLINGIFGKGTATFDTAATDTNNVIGALARIGDFVQFKECFTARLNRLNQAISTNTRLTNPILNAVNQIADHSNWDGAYAELCALDYFLDDPRTGASMIELDATVSAAQTLASDMGLQNANHDLRSASFGVSMDTKLLSDKSADILNGIFKEALKAKGIKSLTIIPSYPLDQSFTDFQSNRKALVSELITLLDVVNRPRTAASNVTPELSYQFAWNAGVFSSEQEYNPGDHAQNHHHLLFGHAKKFSKIEPTVLVFVHFPWSGEPLWIDASAKQFFKGLGSNFFDLYQGSPKEAKTLYRQFKTSISLEQVTKHLSGIVFLQDRSILASDTGQVNVDASYILNMHATHTLIGTPFEQYLQDRQALDLRTFSPQD